MSLPSSEHFQVPKSYVFAVECKTPTFSFNTCISDLLKPQTILDRQCLVLLAKGTPPTPVERGPQTIDYVTPDGIVGPISVKFETDHYATV